jgi:hypothetical protein
LDTGPQDPSRRRALTQLGTGLGALALWPYVSEEGAHAFARIQATGAAPAPVFLTAAEFAAVDLAAETIIPTDAQSPGARAARVVDYIDLLLSESSEEAQRSWREGLVALDRASTARFKQPFARLTADQATTILTEASRNELDPKTPLELFFRAAKEATIRGYYTSEIGIHQDLQYQGNKFLGEFVGCTHPEHGYQK